MIAVSATIIADDTITAIANLSNRSADTLHLHRIAGARLKQDILRNFRVGGYYPKKWQKSKKKTGRTLVRTGTLKRSYSYRATTKQVAVGTSVPYALVHQLGTKKANQVQYHLHRKRTFAAGIPARPMLPIRNNKLNPASISFILQSHAKYILGDQA
jgi:phage gpG-like protein